jgi:Tfp pilus assembly protein PilV
LILHLVVLIGALLVTPEDYSSQLGYYAGPVVFFSSILLWGLLFVSLFVLQSRLGIVLFSCFVLVQGGFVALVGLHFRTEQRVLQSIWKENIAVANEWAAQMKHFSMEPLDEMTLGKRKLTLTQLQELQARARDGEAQLDVMQLDLARWQTDAKRRVSAVSATEARNFRLGMENGQQAYSKEAELFRGYLAKHEKLLGFLIEREGQFSQTPSGLKFKKAEDGQAFNAQVSEISLLEKQFALQARQITLGAKEAGLEVPGK